MDRAGTALGALGMLVASHPAAYYVEAMREIPGLLPLVKFGVAAPLTYHYIGGLRHLVRPAPRRVAALDAPAHAYASAALAGLGQPGGPRHGDGQHDRTGDGRRHGRHRLGLGVLLRAAALMKRRRLRLSNRRRGRSPTAACAPSDAAGASSCSRNSQLGRAWRLGRRLAASECPASASPTPRLSPSQKLCSILMPEYRHSSGLNTQSTP